MRNKKAIEILNRYDTNFCHGDGRPIPAEQIADAIDIAVSALEQQDRERWRSVEKEGGPEEDGEYLITWESPKNGRRFIADVECEVYISNGTCTWILPDYMEVYGDVKIIAWRPIPDLYNEEK